MRFDRRGLLKAAGLSGVVSIIRGVPLRAQQNSKVSLPPSIAALQSMGDQAKPITVEERRARIAKAQQLMAERKMDALFCWSGARRWCTSRVCGGGTASVCLPQSFLRAEKPLACALHLKRIGRASNWIAVRSKALKCSPGRRTRVLTNWWPAA